MIQLGICTGFIKEEKTFTIPHLPFLEKMGFDYLELPLNEIVALEQGEFTGLKAMLAELSLPVTACNCFMDGRIPLTGPEADPVKYGAYIERAVGRAAALGVKKLVLGSGASRNVPARFPMARAMEQLLAAIDKMAREIGSCGMELELEHLNRGESNILTSFGETTALVREKNNPCVKSILDFYHFFLGNEDRALISRRIDAVGHVHYARTLGRTFPALADMEAEGETLRLLKEAGYQGTISMECSFPLMGEEPQAYLDTLAAFQGYLA